MYPTTLKLGDVGVLCNEGWMFATSVSLPTGEMSHDSGNGEARPRDESLGSLRRPEEIRLGVLFTRSLLNKHGSMALRFLRRISLTSFLKLSSYTGSGSSSSSDSVSSTNTRLDEGVLDEDVKN